MLLLLIIMIMMTMMTMMMMMMMMMTMTMTMTMTTTTTATTTTTTTRTTTTTTTINNNVMIDSFLLELPSMNYFSLGIGKQLTTFNQQGVVSIGASKDQSGRVIRPFHGIIAGRMTWWWLQCGVFSVGGDGCTGR